MLFMDVYSFQILLLFFVDIFNIVIEYIVSVLPFFMYDFSYLIFYILTVSGDVEPNSGPRLTRHHQCCILYVIICGLHGNLTDLICSLQAV